MSTPANDVAKTLGLDRQSKVTSRLKPYLVWGGTALLIVLLVWFWIGRQSTGQVQYQTQAVKRGGLTVMVSATGTLQPTNQVDVGSEISGTIKTVEVDYNDQVTRGQVLAKIDTTKLEAQVKQTAASTEAARARVLQTQATVGEAKANLDRAIADGANARAAVAQAEATLEAQRTDLAKAVIRSPIKGVVLKRAAEPGQTVAATFQTPVLFTLAEDLTQMELHVDVDEADVGKVREAQSASFTVDAYPDRTFPARITQVRFGSKTVAGVVTYETVLKVDNSGLLLRPGMTGTANITVQHADDALLVPNAALRFTPPQASPKPAGGGGLVSSLLPRPPRSAPKAADSAEDKQPHVWVLREGKPEKVMLKTGMTDGIMTEVREGKLEPGMAVAVDVIETKK
ncbi:MAG: efflux RND transporter periplasmic adaptor subunit [Betaproteobacteria bacterium]|nr:efflux RND transporter periplasmic adaptor subunit [Betaproteobacteria bacterium]